MSDFKLFNIILLWPFRAFELSGLDVSYVCICIKNRNGTVVHTYVDRSGTCTVGACTVEQWTYVDLPGTCTYLTMYTVLTYTRNLPGLESIKKRSTLASSTRKISPLYLGGEGEGKYWTTHAQWSMYPPESNSLDKLWPRVHLGLARFSRVTLS